MRTNLGCRFTAEHRSRRRSQHERRTQTAERQAVCHGDAVAESTLRGHLKPAQGEEEKGSQSYVPPDPKNDKALTMAEDLLRGTTVNAAFPPNPSKVVPN